MSNGNFDWEGLLREIGNGEVIPVIGRELLPYHRDLAKPLAATLKLSDELGATDICTIAETQALQGNRKEFFRVLGPLLAQYSAIPETIRRLTDIREFRLFLTTDYASVIECALRESNRSPRTIAFAPRNRRSADLNYPPEEYTVYHLLGHVDRFPLAALTTVDQLEFLYALQTPEGATDLMRILRARTNLLFLGCDFPEWIAGFFVRILMGKAFDSDDLSRGMEVVANGDSATPSPPRSLNAFLRANQVEVFAGDAHTFVKELHSRYAPKNATWTPPRIAKGHVFVSYMREDAAPARALVDQLRANDLPVWFDEQKILPGDNFDNLIRRAIEKDSCAFIPIISRQSLAVAGGSYFVKEWNWASAQQSRRLGTDKFVFPVIVDPDEPPDTDPDDRKPLDTAPDDRKDIYSLLDEAFPAFAQLHIIRCPGGQMTSKALIDELVESRKRFGRRSRDGQ